MFLVLFYSCIILHRVDVFNHGLMFEHIVCSQHFTVIIDTANNYFIRKYFLIFWRCKFLEVELLAQMCENVHTAFLDIAKYLSKGTVQCSSLPSKYESACSHNLANRMCCHAF